MNAEHSNDQAHTTATQIWRAINEALEKHCPEKGPCFKESMRDKLAESLRDIFAHVVNIEVEQIATERDLFKKRYELLMEACGEVVGEMRNYAGKRHSWAMRRLDIAMRDADELKLP